MTRFEKLCHKIDNTRICAFVVNHFKKKNILRKTRGTA